MKAMLILIVLIAAVLVGVFYYGGYGSFDPTKQGEDNMAKITPGMTWQQVIDTTAAPKKYSYFIKKTKKSFGEEIEFLQPSVPVDFDRNRFNEKFTNGEFPFGFSFRYVYSRSVAFEVLFDDVGMVIEVGDLPTEADLFQMKRD